MGGELVASMTYLVETSPPQKRGVAGSWSLFGSVSGVLLGSLTMTLLDWLLSAEALTAWGWRVPFLGGLAIFALGVWLRRDIPKDQVENRQSMDKPSNPLREVLFKTRGRVLHISSVLMLFSSSFYVLFVWFPTYLTKILPVPIAHADEINLVGMTVLLASIFGFGSLSDRLGYKEVVLIGTVFMTLSVYPLFVFVDHGSFGAALTTVLLFAIGCGALLGPMPALLVSSFPPNVRSSAIGLSYNITLAIFEGPPHSWRLGLSTRHKTSHLLRFILPLWGLSASMPPLNSNQARGMGPMPTDATAGGFAGVRMICDHFGNDQLR